MYRFDVNSEADFVELKAMNCETAPDLNHVIVIFVQLNYKPEKVPILLQFVSLTGKTMVNGKFRSNFVDYYSIGSRVRGVTSYLYDAPLLVSTYNWLMKNDYYQSNDFTEGYENIGEKIEASKDFAVLLLNTTKSKLPQETVNDRIKEMQYENGINGISRIYLNDENLVNFIFDTLDDCMIFSVNQEELNENNFGKKLSDLMNKPILDYDIRAQTRLSINVCGNKLIVAPFSPNAENNCDGIFTQYDCIFKSTNPLKSELETNQRPEFAQTSKSCSLTWKRFISKRFKS
uniref:Uncharacterized protein n=1 Tax=Panagrolaimus sp. ES5 TaxID=591445 RepID=A0AC34G8Y9_9BILA